MRIELQTLLAAFVLIAGAAGQEGAGTDPVVVTVRPTVRDVERTSSLVGNIEPFEVVQLHAKVTGYVEAVLVDIGDRVTRGQELVRLSVPEMAPEVAQAQAEVQAATARLDKAHADADLAATEARRLTELRARLPGAVTEQDVDVALARETVAAAEVAIAAANQSLAGAAVTRLEVLMTYASIRAPFDGVVTRRMVHTGALVSAPGESGMPLLQVMRDDLMRLVLDVPGRVAPLVRLGQEITFRVDALPGRTFHVAVARTAASLSPQSRLMRVEADVEHATGCRPGMYAKATLVYQQIKDALQVPSRAIRYLGDEPSLLLVDGGVLRAVPVVLVEDDGTWSTVTGKTLSADSAVVIDAPPDVSPGQRVRVRREGDSP